MTDIITLKERAETAYRAVCKLAEENDEFGDHVIDRIDIMKEVLDLAVCAEKTAKTRYETAIIEGEELLRMCYHDFDISPETMLDPDIHAAVSSMLHGADAGDEKKKEEQP